MAAHRRHASRPHDRGGGGVLPRRVRGRVSGGARGGHGLAKGPPSAFAPGLQRAATTSRPPGGGWCDRGWSAAVDPHDQGRYYSLCIEARRRSSRSAAPVPGTSWRAPPSPPSWRSGWPRAARASTSAGSGHARSAAARGPPAPRARQLSPCHPTSAVGRHYFIAGATGLCQGLPSLSRSRHNPRPETLAPVSWRACSSWR